jgi:sugar phosphate isomerase/epimerase
MNFGNREARNMNIGIRLHDSIPGTIAERLAFSRKQGFSCAHLALSKTIEGFTMNEAPKLLAREGFDAEIRGMFQQNGMECAVLGCYLSLTAPSAEERDRIREIYYAHLAFARKIGAGVVGTETPAGKGSTFEKNAPDSEDAFQSFLDNVKPVVRRAEEEGMILAVEPVVSHIVSTPEKAERMLDAIGSDSIRIILDAVNLLGPGNVDRKDAVIEEAIRRLGDRVSVLHMKDYIPENGGLKAVACGTGEMRYEALLRFGKTRDLPMTLENTVPENAEAARMTLERIAAGL